MSVELSSQAAWYVIQTKPRKEQEVFNNFCVRGLDGLFPTMLDGRHYTMEKPLFPALYSSRCCAIR